MNELCLLREKINGLVVIGGHTKCFYYPSEVFAARVKGRFIVAGLQCTRHKGYPSTQDHFLGSNGIREAKLIS